MVSRVFKAIDRYGAELEFELKEPDNDAVRHSDMQYRIAYSAALKEGILPREKMREIFKENGIWDDDDETAMMDILKELASLTLKLDDTAKRGDKDECIKIAGEMGKTRVRMFQMFMVQQSCFMNSCEGFAELVRLESLMASSVVIKANGVRYWKTYKDYVIERDHNDKATVAAETGKVNSLVLDEKKDELINEYPEQKWLRQIHSEFLQIAQQRAREMIQEKVKEAVDADKVASANTINESGS
jgi:hypothetical protein